MAMILRILSIIVFCILLIEGQKSDDVQVNHSKYWKELRKFLNWKLMRLENDNNYAKPLKFPIRFDDRNYRTTYDERTINSRVIQDLPPANKGALVARYVVNQADWAAVATISTREDIRTFPFVSLVSLADGPIGNGTGIPYMYLTPLDFTAKDLAEDHRTTLLVSLAQGNYCEKEQMDPMDPRCVRVMLTGKIKAVKTDTTEYDTAKQLFFGRHPKLENMPPNHGFFFAKLDISTISVLNEFGGPKYISVKDYFNPPKNY